MPFTLMSLETLQQHLERGSGPIVVDGRDLGAYAAGHVPGARWLGWEEWCEPAPANAGPVLQQAGYWGVLDDRDPARVAARLGVAGLRHDRPIVVYDEGARSWGRAARVAWMLLYLGAHDVALLDATWNHWLSAGQAIEVGYPDPPAATFAVSPQAERRLRRDDLIAAYQSSDTPVLLDTRRPDDFDGRREPYLPRRGHLPGALLMPFLALFDDDDRFVSRERYLAALPAGVREAERVATYCEVGVRASAVALLHEHYTGRIVPVYDGSLIEWGLSPELAVDNAETAADPRRGRLGRHAG